MVVAITIAIGLGVALFTGSALISAIAAGTFIAICVGTTIVGWWVVHVFALMAMGLLYLARTA